MTLRQQHDSLTRKGLYRIARAQGYGRYVSALFAWRQHRADLKKGIVRD